MFVQPSSTTQGGAAMQTASVTVVANGGPSVTFDITPKDDLGVHAITCNVKDVTPALAKALGDLVVVLARVANDHLPSDRRIQVTKIREMAGPDREK